MHGVEPIYEGQTICSTHMVWEKNMADNREQVKDRPELPWDDSFCSDTYKNTRQCIRPCNM